MLSAVVRVDSSVVLLDLVLPHSWPDLSYFVTGPVWTFGIHYAASVSHRELCPSSRSPGPQTR